MTHASAHASRLGRITRRLARATNSLSKPEAFVIALPWGDATQWVRNVQAAGGCTVTWRGADHRTDAPEILGWIAAAPAFSGWQRALLGIGRVKRFLRLHRAGTP